jgi:alpha-beta hydrolase superfamily lysophospholipase
VTYPGGARGGGSLTAKPGFHEPTSKHATLVDAARWACYRTLWPRQAGLPHTAEAAMRKCSSAGVLGDLGEGGWPRLVEDIGLLSAGIRAQHPGLPLILLGHSMGSFAVQQYLLDHSADADAVILTGTAVIDLLEPALDLDQPLDLAMFNAAFQPARTDYDWLSRDETIVDAYIADPRCGFGLETGAAKAMFAGARRLADPAEVAGMRPGLPVYIAAGESDPVNGQLALLAPLADRYCAAGLADVTVRTYPEARHEILNEINNAEVIAEIGSWADRVLASAGLS